MIELLKIINFVTKINKSHKINYIILLFLIFTSSIFEIFAIYVAIPIFNSVTSKNDFSFTFLDFENPINLFLFYFGLLIFLSVFKIFLVFIQNKFSLRLGAELSTILYDKILHKNQNWHLNNNSTSSINNLTTHLSTVISSIRGLVLGFSSFFTALFLIAFLFIYSFLSTIMSISIILFLIIIYNKIITETIKQNSVIIADLGYQWLNFLRESISNIKVIKLNKLQKFYIQTYNEIELKLRKTKAISLFYSQSNRAFLELFGYLLMFFLVIILNLFQNYNFEIIKELVILYLFSLLRLLPYFSQISSSRIDIKSATVSINTIYLLLSSSESNKEESIFSIDKPSNNLKSFEEILFENIEYRLIEKNRPLFNNFNLHINSGDKVLVIGKSGSGKSTFIDIISGFLNVSNGKIFINNLDSNSVNLDFWQKNIITLISQNNFLLDGTISENLTIGSEENKNNKIKIEKILKIVELNMPISKQVGENGCNLSGGERQRLIIARGLFNINPILIMDEATSALDSETEYRIINNIIIEYKDLTLIAVMHKPSMQLPFNKIIDFSNFKPK